MTEQEIRALRQFCFQQASLHLQWNGKSDSTNPTIDEILIATDKIFLSIAGEPV
jgi:hypothetical protein